MLQLRISLTVFGVWLFLLTTNTYSIAQQKPKWLKIITDKDQIANYLDIASLSSSKPQKFYTSARIFPQVAVNNSEMPLRRPYHGERCPCPYDFAINESRCGGRASGKTTCFAPKGAFSLLILNSVNCETKVRSILNIDIYDKNNKQITTYSPDTLTGGAYPVAVKVSDPAELSVIKAVCK
ncbi:hypothetical protein [Microcoleus sp. Pol12B4]|uniref:hypothetical protein n=1 Tax=Microcoleus sp. Pol12B4 TaxID=3055395 RepID=UPI002FD2DD11